MSLREVQAFVTYYLRDPEFREGYRNGSRDALEAQLRLDNNDIKLVREINLDELDHIAVGFRDDRVAKRQSEYEEFLKHLGAYMDPAAFLAAYDRDYPGGLETQSLELDRFLAFAVEFLSTHRLPDYLISLAYFCYSFCKIAIAPVQKQGGPVEPGELHPYHSIRLREPYQIAKFRYDVVRIAQSESSSDLAGIPPQPTELLIQKDHSLFKRAQVYYCSELPLVGALLSGQRMLFDLVSELPSEDYHGFINHISDLAHRGIIDVITPAYFGTYKSVAGNVVAR